MACCIWAFEKEDITESLSQIKEQDAKGWLVVMIKSLRHKELVRVIVTLWAIWYIRRKVVHKNIYQSMLSMHQFVSNFMASIELVKSQERARPQAHESLVWWIPPPIDLTKMNTCCSCFWLRIRAAAAVARDVVRKFLGASAVVLEGRFEPDMVVAIPCIEGLALASDLVLRDFRLPCDNAEHSGREHGLLWT